MKTNRNCLPRQRPFRDRKTNSILFIYGHSSTCLRRGVVVSGVRRMNEVNARQARLVPGRVTVFGRVYRLGM